MAKRFTDTNKWKDTWFQGLPLKYKLFWIYLLDECDHAGVWKPNIGLAQFQVGDTFEESELKRVFADRVQFLPSGYWFVVKFIYFQYGGLKNDKVGISARSILKMHNLLGAFEGLSSPLVGPIDKDKVKVKDKDKDKQFFGENHSAYFIVASTHDHPACRVNGPEGLDLYFESQGSIVTNRQLAPKFMTIHTGKKFNDFSHVWNAYALWVEKQFK